MHSHWNYNQIKGKYNFLVSIKKQTPNGWNETTKTNLKCSLKCSNRRGKDSCVID